MFEADIEVSDIDSKRTRERLEARLLGVARSLRPRKPSLSTSNFLKTFLACIAGRERKKAQSEWLWPDSFNGSGPDKSDRKCDGNSYRTLHHSSQEDENTGIYGGVAVTGRLVVQLPILRQLLELLRAQFATARGTPTQVTIAEHRTPHALTPRSSIPQAGSTRSTKQRGGGMRATRSSVH